MEVPTWDTNRYRGCIFHFDWEFGSKTSFLRFLKPELFKKLGPENFRTVFLYENRAGSGIGGSDLASFKGKSWKSFVKPLLLLASLSENKQYSCFVLIQTVVCDIFCSTKSSQEAILQRISRICLWNWSNLTLRCHFPDVFHAEILFETFRDQLFWKVQVSKSLKTKL